MPWIKVWLHFVWSTKGRSPYLQDEIRNRVFDHIRQNARAKRIHIDFINGYIEHVHCLISLGADQTIEKLMQLIKGESSFWINKNGLTKTRFEWQEEFFRLRQRGKSGTGAQIYCQAGRSSFQSFVPSGI